MITQRQMTTSTTQWQDWQAKADLDTLFAPLEEPLDSRRTMMNNDKHMTCKQIDI
ncbi:hypothetical protein TRIATDRAFT_260318 [Trichoderma atroviride IMI 206040]|uniref:Uncharacterized protein n=1 Tax=Hypocrea atroviridis (strain ATCC 20476 / IMI 206040) TaxID=452589 RepID=G9PBC1_HYPAI|nr:uncharacterized protein TRIATDRAFT_260318 [Trichoderma atroviride IMI 206040]EHK39669.1 hypothetical protein TRIATDRAFT_260318 [Trichoderma atroviride IMI 206040]